MKILKNQLLVKKCIFLFFFLSFICKDTFSQDKILINLPDFYKSNDIIIWDFITKYQYGVAGSGFIDKDQFIGMCFAKNNKGGPWKPIDGFKHTLCGQLYLPHNGKFKEIMGDDGDVDFFIFPDSAFEWLILNSKNPNGNDWINGTILGEISFKEPGNKIENDGATYFQSQPRLDYQNIGIYGAWVTDVDKNFWGMGSHQDYHAEIHPIEQMWQKKEIDTSKTEFYLFSMHDNQGRFTTLDEFTYPGNIIKSSDCDLPWIKYPQIDTFYVPFEVSITGDFINYNIEVLSENNFNSENLPNKSIRLIYNDKILINIQKTSPKFPNIFFYGLGMKDTKTLRGYIGISTSIAKLNSKDGAHLFLKMTRSTNWTNSYITPHH